MIFTIICVVVWVIGFIILEIKSIDCNGGEGTFLMAALLGGVLIFSIMFCNMKPNLEKVKWELAENYEITYKPDFDNSPVFVEFEAGELKLYKKNDGNINEVSNFDIISEGEIASYKSYKKEVKGNFFLWDNKKTKKEILIPIDLIKEWKEQE